MSSPLPQQRPSDHWEGFSKSGRWPKDRVRAVISSGNFAHLEDAALRARAVLDSKDDAGPDATSPNPQTLTCRIDTSVFTNGLYNLILEVAFSDGTYWIARVQHFPVEQGQTRNHAERMLSEVATMRTVRRRTTIPVPEVYAFDVSPANAFGFPYMLTEWMRGRDVGGALALAVPRRHLPKVAGRVADVLSQLEGLSFHKLGRIWCGEACDDEAEPPRVVPLPGASPTSGAATSLEWFYLARQQANRAAMAAHGGDEEWNTACWVLKTGAATGCVVEDRLRGPFPLCHMDLHHGNLLFDGEFNLTGVVDWCHAQTVPIERLAVSPEFMPPFDIPEHLQDENREVLDRVNEFRSLVLEALWKIEKGRIAVASAAGRSWPPGSPIAATMGGATATPSPKGRNTCPDIHAGETRATTGSSTSTSTSTSMTNMTTTAQTARTKMPRTRLHEIMGTKGAEITYRCTYSLPSRALCDGRMVARLLYGRNISWNQLVGLYGAMELR